MYNIVNKDSIYVAGYFGWRKEYRIYEVGDERALIKYLAESYEDISYLMGFSYYRNDAYDKEYFDGYGRKINPRAYEEDAWSFYAEYIANKDKNKKFHYVENKVYQGVFRETPVPYTGKKYRGGPSIRPRKIKHIAKLYSDPEYKKFNRGSRSRYPDGWWDDWDRCVERNWKSQSKRRHQWKE